MTITLLTGLPRSGTTLACACLNTLPDCVALVEPMNVPKHGDADRAVDEIVAFANTTRQRLLEKGIAPSHNVAGAIMDNSFENVRADNGLRQMHSYVSDVKITKPLSSEFHLFIKHPGVFTALALQLAERFPFYAIVRHPLAALASWQTVDTNVSRGHAPAAESFAPDIRNELAQTADLLKRQVTLLRWMFRVYAALPRSQVVTYESIVADPTKALAPLSRSMAPVTHPVRSFDLRARYPNVELSRLARALLLIEEDLRVFYPRLRESMEPYLKS